MVLLPFTTTLAPMTGSPEESFTLPVTFCWAKAVNEKLNRVSNKTNVSFYIKFKVIHTFTAGMNEEDVFFSP